MVQKIKNSSKAVLQNWNKPTPKWLKITADVLLYGTMAFDLAYLAGSKGIISDPQIMQYISFGSVAFKFLSKFFKSKVYG